jgi:hypothetical protein
LLDLDYLDFNLNMKNKIFNFFLVLCILAFCLSCRTTNSSVFSYTKPEIILLSEMPNGTVVVKSFGSGYTQMECVENAKMSAIKEIIFKGINGSKPLIGGSNFEENNKNYFSNFFSSDGPYNNYVYLSNRGNIDKDDRFEVKGSRGRRKITSRRTDRLLIGVELVIERESLRTELFDKLIK